MLEPKLKPKPIIKSIIFLGKKVYNQGPIGSNDFFNNIMMWPNGDGPQEDLINFGYKINIKAKNLTFFNIYGYILEPCIKSIDLS